MFGQLKIYAFQCGDYESTKGAYKLKVLNTIYRYKDHSYYIHI